MTEKAVNYTPEMTSKVIEMYKAGTPVENIAEAVGRSVRSVIAKLSREGAYTPKSATKAGTRVTKADLIAKLEKAMGAEAGTLETLEKASKEALEFLVANTEPAFETDEV